MTQTIQRQHFHSQRAATTAQLFTDDTTDTILLSVHLLGKPTADQLYRLHRDRISGPRAMRGILRRLASDGLLAVIKPIDLNHPSRHLPYVYLDTTASRRHLEEVKGIPFRRPPELPSRDWRFLRHDVTLVDELISFELTARKNGIPFGNPPIFSGVQS